MAKTVFSKDTNDNNCLHYCYMIDLPEVRQILRDNNLFNDRAHRLNVRGQLPGKLRHFIKAEDSGVDTEDEALYENQEREIDDFAIVGKGLSGAVDPMAEEGTTAEELIVGDEHYDLHDASDKYPLKFNKTLTKKQKIAHYEPPDYCFVTRADTLQLLRMELSSLVARGGIYYSIYDKIEEPEDFN